MSRYHWFVVAILAFLQFTIILDFMTLSPLGPFLMPALKISAPQFSLVVSAYAFAAGISGILAAGYADRFDRKKFLLFFYTGFLFATLGCGLATTYPALLLARIATGLFAGVLGSVVLAITTDLFPIEKRGRVMGVIQTAFASSQVLGIPVGLYLANLWDWHAPFLMIVIIGLVVGVLIAVYLKPVAGHLTQGAKTSAFGHLLTTISNPRYLQGFATTALLSTGGFMLMPFSSVYTVHNLGLSTTQLPLLYMVTGLCAMAAGPLVGRLTDSVGSFKVFSFGTLLTIIMVTIYTHLGTSPLITVMIVNSILFIGISSRMIPSQTIISVIPRAGDRGSYMAVSSSVQQLSGGLASILAGVIVTVSLEGSIEHYDQLGYVVVIASLITLYMMSRIQKMVAHASPPR